MKEINLEQESGYILCRIADENLPLMEAALKATEQSYAPTRSFMSGRRLC